MRASKGEWADGERRLMADLLANLGRIAAKPLADEQLRRLEELHAGVERGSYDRLHIAVRLANTRWAYERWEDAIALLEPALVEFRTASGGVLPQSANEALSTYVNFLMAARASTRAASRSIWPNSRRRPIRSSGTGSCSSFMRSTPAPFPRDGRVSLGRGQTLYKAAEKKMLADLDTPDHNHRYQLAALALFALPGGASKEAGWCGGGLAVIRIQADSRSAQAADEQLSIRHLDRGFDFARRCRAHGTGWRS